LLFALAESFALADCHAYYRADSTAASLATLSGILTSCIAAGKVPEFIAEFKNALQRRQDVRSVNAARMSRDLLTHVAQEQERQRKEEEKRAAEEQARVASMARDLRILRLLLALMQVTYDAAAARLFFLLRPPSSSPCSPHPLQLDGDEHNRDGMSLLERLHALGFTHDATLESMCVLLLLAAASSKDCTQHSHRFSN
jgi:hypothetical protein